MGSKSQASALEIGAPRPALIVGRCFKTIHADIAQDMRGQAKRLYGPAALRHKLGCVISPEQGGQGQKKTKKAWKSDHFMHSLTLWSVLSSD